MILLPLAPSAHASAWNPAGVPGTGGGQPPATPTPAPASPSSTLDPTCRFCGLDAAGWQEPFHVNGDHADASPGNLVPACPLCHLCQHLDRPHIHAEAALIWLPEMSQAAVIALVRAAHLVLHAHREPAHMERGRPVRDQPALRPAWAALHALRERAAPAEARLGTASPLDLAAALLGLAPAARARGSALLRGVRLLPLGRLYRDGHDIYPEVLDAWTRTAAASPGAVAPSPAHPSSAHA